MVSEGQDDKRSMVNSAESPNPGNNNNSSIEIAPTAQSDKSIEIDSALVSDRPILCILEDEEHLESAPKQRQPRRCRMFRVLRSKGKALASGGFGVTIAKGEDLSEPEKNDTDSEEEGTAGTDGKLGNKKNDQTELLPTNQKTTNNTKSAEYLFVEEVLFLHEMGLLRALLPAKDGSNNNPTNASESHDSATPLDTSQLYQLLPSLGISLPIYRVYSHLRSQDFRVLRHDPNRYEVLCRQKEYAEQSKQRKLLARQQQKDQQEQNLIEEESLPKHEAVEESGGVLEPQAKNPRNRNFALRRKIRESIQSTPPPSIFSNTDKSSGTMNICWDAYNPNSNFGKTHPGLPDFYVTATYYNVPMVAFSQLNALLKQKCHGIPLKVATVSDSGTVVMFGVTDYGIPSLAQKPQNTN